MDNGQDYFLLPIQGQTRSAQIFYCRLVLAIKLANYVCYHHIDQEGPKHHGFYKTERYDLKLAMKCCHLLKHKDFMQVHSGTIIHRHHVVDCYRETTGGKNLILILSNGMKVSVSRKHDEKVSKIYFPHGKIKCQKATL